MFLRVRNTCFKTSWSGIPRFSKWICLSNMSTAPALTRVSQHFLEYSVAVPVGETEHVSLYNLLALKQKCLDWQSNETQLGVWIHNLMAYDQSWLENKKSKRKLKVAFTQCCTSLSNAVCASRVTELRQCSHQSVDQTHAIINLCRTLLQSRSYISNFSLWSFPHKVGFDIWLQQPVSWVSMKMHHQIVYAMKGQIFCIMK